MSETKQNKASLINTKHNLTFYLYTKMGKIKCQIQNLNDDLNLLRSLKDQAVARRLLLESEVVQLEMEEGSKE